MKYYLKHISGDEYGPFATDIDAWAWRNLSNWSCIYKDDDG